MTSNSRTMDELSSLLYDWAYDRGFFKENGGTLEGQIKQMLTEVGEFALEAGKAEWPKYDNDEMYIELGDVMVTAIVTAHLLGVIPGNCLESAFEKIKDRKGKMVKGRFVKNDS